MNEPTDETILAAARRALADAAPEAPSPALLDLVRREAARRRALRRRARRAAFAAVLAAAAALVLAVLPVRPAAPSAGASAPADADAALRLLLFDATEARAAALAAAAADDASAGETAAADGTAVADGADWESLSFADALLAWQEEPLPEMPDVSAVF